MSSLLAALGLVFVAELGDKTQLVALGLGARHRLGPVLVGITLAYALTNLVSVVVGGVLGAALPTRAINVGGGLLFLAFAAWTWRGAGGANAHADEQVPELRGHSVVLAVAGSMMVAELGDKTMLATATLAADGRPVLTWIGATVGIVLAGALGVLVGRALGGRIPPRATRLGSAIVFAGFGVAMLVAALR